MKIMNYRFTLFCFTLYLIKNQRDHFLLYLHLGCQLIKSRFLGDPVPTTKLLRRDTLSFFFLQNFV